ncbi:hypothetical protein [Sphingomonas sp. LR55]|uniref:hypothetical protein n=1 Tax=Sphingomonas sp. LR55 TaxID=3050231 RepID=UPI002FE00D59
MLVMVPQGCDEAGSARLVQQWVDGHFCMPASYSNHTPICINLVSDGLESSAHFASAICQAIEKRLAIKVDTCAQDFPTDILQNSIEAAIEAGAYPILMIERFHAFASIRDGGMASMLSRLRSMESDGQLTTLAFSPIGYDAIRRLMDSEQPFLNSVYGDMHDEAIMTPLGNADFLAEAASRNVDQATAHRLFSLGGGPDTVFVALLDLAPCDRMTLISQCAARSGPAIDRFLARVLPAGAESEHLLANLAVGRVNAAQEAALLNHPLSNFLCKRNSAGELVCASPVIARRILTKDLSIWAQYGQCLQSMEASDFVAAAEMTLTMSDQHPRLATFRNLVVIRGALTAVPGRGLLGFDWQAAADASKRIRQIGAPGLEAFRGWLDVVDQATALIVDRKSVRLQADLFTRRAAEKAVRHLLLFMMSALVEAAGKLVDPASRVHTLVNLPEAILQSLASGYCEIDYANPPEVPPEADYDRYFNAKEAFAFPPASMKLTLGALLVIVPALLSQRMERSDNQLTDPEKIRPLQQKLVDAVRNPASHTIANFSSKDAVLLEELSRAWLGEWCGFEGLSSAAELPIACLAPDAEQLRCILTE